MNASNILEQRSFTVGAEEFKIVVYRDSSEPFDRSFVVFRNGEIMPLKAVGGQLHYTKFTVSTEIEQDAKALGLDSPFEALVQEAQRMVEVTLNG